MPDNQPVTVTKPAVIPKTVRKKKKSKKPLIFIILGVLLILIITAVVVSGKKEKAITVQTEKVTRRNITQVVSGTGTIRPETKVDESYENRGEIKSLHFKKLYQVK